MAPHIEQMRKNIAETLRIDLKQINVKQQQRRAWVYRCGLGHRSFGSLFAGRKIRISKQEKVMIGKE